MPDAPTILRSVPLLDIEIMRGGDGRTVTAYAAVFDTPYEVRDHQGHYDEIINRSAFNRQLGRGIGGVQVLFNHGMTNFHTPSERYSMPIGTPLEIKAEAKGLLTVTRYANTPLADEVLELISSGAIRAQSFRGAIVRSSPARSGANGRPVIERQEMGLMEYGPTPFPVANSAAILAVRSSLLAAQVGELSPEERAELFALLQSELALGGPSVAAPEPQGQPAEAPATPAPEAPASGPSVELLIAANANRQRR